MATDRPVADRKEYHQRYKFRRTRIGIRRRVEALKYIGGKCNNCGYSGNSSAMDFHHTGTKNFKLDTYAFIYKPFADCLAEAKNCIILCARCHRIHHANYAVEENW